MKKPERVEINEDLNKSEFQEILFNWEACKTDVNIVGKVDKIRSELQHSCSKEVRTISENDLIEEIRKVAVNKTTVSVHRSKFFQMAQTPGETPNAYVARREAANLARKFSRR